MDGRRGHGDDDRVHRLARAFEALRRCNRALVRASSEASLVHEICRVLVEVGDYVMAWVGYADHDEARTVRCVAQAGADDGYLEAIRVSWADVPEGRGPTGTAIRERCTRVNRDSATQPGYGPWRAEALRRGYASSISVPMVLDGAALGALTVYCARVDAFDAEEQELLEQLAEDLAYGIGGLREHARREEAEAKLLHAQKMELVGRLAGGVAHDFNNLLAVILGGCELALEADAAAPVRAELREIHEAAHAARTLTKQLLGLSRAVPADLREVELATWLRDSTRMFTLIVGRETELCFDLRPDAGRVRADTTQLQAVVLNLLANARDAMGDHGTVTVALASTVVPADAEPALERVRGRACARLSVADTGQGMSPEVLAHLFEPFFTTKPVGRGTGLGLATARGIIEAHGGAMHVESAPGRGSRFDVLLPCVGAA